MRGALIEIGAEAVGVGGDLFHVLGAEGVLDGDAIEGGIASLELCIEGVLGDGTTKEIPTAPDGADHAIRILESIGLQFGRPLLIGLTIAEGSLETDHNPFLFFLTRNKKSTTLTN